MIPRIQSRIGERGTCFITALASVLNLKESQVPDFPEANCDPGVDEFLKPRGLKYEEYPITDPAPSGWHFILGTSPRGGQHCVVGLNGKLAHDPHPQDGTGRGLVEPKSWGVLEPVGAQDAALLRGRRLNAAAELLRTKHDEIKNDPVRTGEVSAITIYSATHRTVVALVKEAEALLGHADLDDDPRYWWSKLASAKANLMESERYAEQHNYGVAVRYQESAFTLAHSLIDKMRNSGRMRGRDVMGRLTAEQKWDAYDDTQRRRARLHHALDRVLDTVKAKDATALRWKGSPAPTGKYSSFEKRSWPGAEHSNGAPAVALYADVPYSKENAESGKTQITVQVAEWYKPEERGTRAAFKWRTLAQRVTTLKQAKELAGRFFDQHKDFIPEKY